MIIGEGYMKRILSSTFFILILTFCFSSLTFAENVNIQSGVDIKGSMDSENAIDTYQFTTKGVDGDVYIILDELTGGFRLSLYDEQGTYIPSDSEYVNGEAINISRTLNEGTYTIKIEPYAWSRITSASYRLKATYPSSFTRNDTTFEPNDTFETALPIKTGQFYNSESDRVLDVDTYQFTTDSVDGDFYLTLDNLTGGFGVAIYDERGAYITGDSEYRTGESIAISRTLGKGTYYIKIKPYGWSRITSASYRLKATFPSSFTRNFSTFEPNDTIDTSLPIRRGQFYKSKSDNNLDIDTYQFTTNKEGEVVITLDEMTGGFGVSLYNEQGGYITGDSEYVNGKSIQFSQTLKKGTYFIKIKPYGWSRITSANYRLKANFSADTTIYADLETNQHWSENIFWAMNKKLITDYKNVVNKKTGKKENLLKPHDKLTEAQFLTVLFRYTDLAELSKTKSTNKKFSHSVVYQMAAKYKLPTKSTLKSQSSADKLITRGKMAEILVSKHLGKKVSETEAVDFFIMNDFTSAKTTKDFKSSDGLTRAEIVTFMKKYDNFLNK